MKNIRVTFINWKHICLHYGIDKVIFANGKLLGIFTQEFSDQICMYIVLLIYEHVSSYHYETKLSSTYILIYFIL